MLAAYSSRNSSVSAQPQVISLFSFSDRACRSVDVFVCRSKDVRMEQTEERRTGRPGVRQEGFMDVISQTRQ